MAIPSSFEPDAGRSPDRPGQAAVERAVAGAARTERVLLAALALGCAWVLVRHPGVRRATWRLARQVTGLAAAGLAREVRRAWRDSAPRSADDAA